jgi:hypothetical protein
MKEGLKGGAKIEERERERDGERERARQRERERERERERPRGGRNYQHHNLGAILKRQ